MHSFITRLQLWPLRSTSWSAAQFLPKPRVSTKAEQNGDVLAHFTAQCRLSLGVEFCSAASPYPFAPPVTVDEVEGAVLVDQLKSMDWGLRLLVSGQTIVKPPARLYR